jgi:hypothetical protein
MSRIPGVFAALILLGAALPARALDESTVILYVCNKGTVPVEVVAAEKNEPFMGVGVLRWNIRGKTITPGKCTNVYGSSSDRPAYIAFGFDDAKGQWGSGTITHVPDFGNFFQWFQAQKVLVGAAQAMCTRKDEYRYSVEGDIPGNCADMNLANAPDPRHGPYVPLTAALYLETVGQLCTDRGVPTTCEYYLNISPSGTDRDLHAAKGTKSGNDAAESAEDSGYAATRRFLQALAKAALEEHENAVKAAADAAEARRQYLMEQPAVRERQQKQILAAADAGDPEAKVLAQMIEREAENNRQRWGTGTHQSPAAFDSQWMGHNVAIVGTVSRVEIDPSGSPQWVSIYFKESPDATFVVCSPYQDLFQERVGMNISVLVGKTLEAAGQVESPRCGQKTSKGSIRVVESTQWQIH